MNSTVQCLYSVDGLRQGPDHSTGQHHVTEPTGKLVTATQELFHGLAEGRRSPSHPSSSCCHLRQRFPAVCAADKRGPVHAARCRGVLFTADDHPQGPAEGMCCLFWCTTLISHWVCILVIYHRQTICRGSGTRSILSKIARSMCNPSRCTHCTASCRCLGVPTAKLGDEHSRCTHQHSTSRQCTSCRTRMVCQSSTSCLASRCNCCLPATRLGKTKRYAQHAL